MLQKLFLTGCIIATTSLAQADFLGVRVGAYQWQQKYDGTASSDGTNVNLRSDLGFDNSRNNVYFAEFDHPLPLLPNIRIQHTDISTTETATLNRAIVIDNVNYAASSAVHTNLDLSHTDATLYYRPLDNWVKVRLGLTVRKFDHGVTVDSLSTGQSAKIDIDAILPMFYAAARFDLPLTGLYIGADTNALAYSGSHLYDSRVNVGYELPFGLGMEAGYRRFDLKYDRHGDHADIVVDGGYAEVFYHF